MSRPRPDPEQLARTLKAKEEWHREQADLPFEEKLRIMLKLQRIHYEMAKLRGDKLEWWQKPWDIEI